MKTETFLSVEAVPPKYWLDLNPVSNLYFSIPVFKAYEEANKDIGFSYIFALKNEKAIAFAYTQLITINIKTITKNIRMWSWLRKSVNAIFTKRPLRVLFCGNIFLSGEYGLYLSKDYDNSNSFLAIAETIETLAKRTKKLHALFIKDFEDESLDITNQLTHFGYTKIIVEPNMIIHLKSKWQDFEDYKADLKSKYRIKANKADAKSKFLTKKLFSIEDIKNHLVELQNLYHNTIANADFNAQVLNLETYLNLKSHLKTKFFVIGYFLEGRLVGFLSAMHNKSHLDAHFIGLDYKMNKTHAIYPRILNDYVRLGIDLGCSQINLGRTASEIKSTLGAEPIRLTCYCKHKIFLLNQLLKPFISNTKVKSYKQHQPFK